MQQTNRAVKKQLQIVIIGGGAAGYFSAITAARANPTAKVTILEKSGQVLSKVKVSGGGRCNVTHACFDVSALVKYYPRGEKQLRGPFTRFSPKDTVEWFAEAGIQLKTEADGRMFPVTDDSSTIVNCLEGEAEHAGVIVRKKTGVKKIIRQENAFLVQLLEEGELYADRILVATGGNPSLSGFNWLSELGHSVVSPVPSLFTFNIPGNNVVELMGVSVALARIKIEGTSFQNEGPLLITHWGMSGPAVLKLSSLAARFLSDRNYKFRIRVSWLPLMKEDEVRKELLEVKSSSAARIINSSNPFDLPRRLWEYLVEKAGIPKQLEWGNCPRQHLNKLISSLVDDLYEVNGKTTFKEEFVTCGGIDLKEIDFKTMESKLVPGLYLAGEVLDIDAVTGGFNFQAAWTTGYLAGLAMADE